MVAVCELDKVEQGLPLGINLLREQRLDQRAEQRERIRLTVLQDLRIDLGIDRRHELRERRVIDIVGPIFPGSVRHGRHRGSRLDRADRLGGRLEHQRLHGGRFDIHALQDHAGSGAIDPDAQRAVALDQHAQVAQVHRDRRVLRLGQRRAQQAEQRCVERVRRHAADAEIAQEPSERRLHAAIRHQLVHHRRDQRIGDHRLHHVDG